MISKLIKDYTLQSNIDEDEIEIIIYGLIILGSSILTSIIILLSGIVVGQPISAIIYLCVLILLRRNVGGYHSNTYIGCLSITILNFMVIVLLQNSLNQYYKEIIGMISIVYSTMKIYTTIPQIHKNRIVNEETIDRCIVNKNINLSIILFTALIIHILAKLNYISSINHFFTISSSLMIVALSVNKIDLKGGEKYEKNSN